MRDILGYQGKCVVVTGAHSGMGAAAARTLVGLGAEVHALDVRPVEAPVKQALVCDLSKRESIDGAPGRPAQLKRQSTDPGSCRGSPREAPSPASPRWPEWAGRRTSRT